MIIPQIIMRIGIIHIVGGSSTASTTGRSG